jgi:HlyD family secretion protein.
MSTHIGEPNDSYSEQIPLDERRYTRLGWLALGVGVFGFLAWAAFAPLDKGVASPGSVTVSGNRKTVQAPASGIIKNIVVKDGDKVKAGEVPGAVEPGAGTGTGRFAARSILHHAGHRRALAG